MKTEGKTFVISGGASGLGAATVHDLHAHGATVAILDLNSETGEALVSSLGSRARFFETDVSSTESIASAVSGVLSWVSETGTPLGGLIAAAGVGNPGKIIDRHGAPLPMSQFDWVLNINLRGSVDLARQLLPAMVRNEPESAELADAERGVLVFVSSAAAYDGQPGQLAYAASKGAIRSMVLPLARELAQYGVRAVAIAPSLFESKMTSMMSGKVRKSLERVMEFPGRAGRPEEFASLVRECVTNKMLNGFTVRLDGAMRMPSRL